MAKLSRVNMSRTVNARNRRPSANWSATKSRLHTWVRDGGPETLAAMHRGSPLSAWLVPQGQAFLSIKAIHQLLSYLPTLAIQQHPDFPVAVTNPSLRDLPNPQPQCRPWLLPALVAEGRDRHPRHPARTPLAHPIGVVPIAHHRGGAARASHFFCQHILEHYLVQS